MDNRNAQATNPAAQETHLRSFINDLGMAVNRIAEINGRAGGIADRLGGAVPEAGASQIKPPSSLSSVPTSIVDELRFSLNRALDHISDCEHRLGRIENMV